MTKESRRFLLLVPAFAALLAGCTKEPTLQETYAPLYRASRSIEGAISVGVSYAALGELLQSLATEVLIASDRASADGEKALVAAYAEVLATYKDSATVWKHQIDSAKYDWLKGRIFQEAELVPIVEKYKLPTETGKMTYTNETFVSLPGDSMQLVWAAAAEKSKTAVALYFASGKPPTP